MVHFFALLEENSVSNYCDHNIKGVLLFGIELAKPANHITKYKEFFRK